MCGENETMTLEAVAGLVGQTAPVTVGGRKYNDATVQSAEPIRDEDGRIVGADLRVIL